MTDGPPKRIAIEHDDYHAAYVGTTRDSRQFFLTAPFVPAIGTDAGREFIALYLFDKSGTLIDSKIEDLGCRNLIDHDNDVSLRDEWLRQLGEVRFGRIEVAPFAIERFGVTFGLIVSEPDDECDEWVVELQPGNYMAFFAPWDSGEYDT